METKNQNLKNKSRANQNKNKYIKKNLFRNDK